MTETEILVGKLTRFLKERNAYDAYVEGLRNGWTHRKTINGIANWCINYNKERHIIDVSFTWSDNRHAGISWSSLHDEFASSYNSLSYEPYEEDKIWDNMWEVQL